MPPIGFEGPPGRYRGAWSSVLFLVAGVMLLGYAAFYGFEIVSGSGVPWLREVLLGVGYVAGLLGVVGVYTSVVDRVPRAAGAGIVVTAGALAGWSVILAGSVGDVVGSVPSPAAVLPGVFFLAHPVAMILAYGLLAAAVLRSRRHAGRVGLFLVAPAALLAALLVGSALRPGAFPVGAFVISTGQGMAHLAVGYALRTQAAADREARSESADGDREVVLHD